jgi:hypothetical protein
VGRQTEKALKNVSRVLTEKRRAPMEKATGVRGGGRHPEGDPFEGEGLDLGVPERGEVAPSGQLGIAFEAVGRVLDDPGRDPGGLEGVHDLVAVPGRGPGLEKAVEGVGIGGPVGQGGEAGVVGPGGPADNLP